MSEERVEEVRTMRAASAARNKWLERQRRGSVGHYLSLYYYEFCVPLWIWYIESMEQRRDREYKLILESELYDLPQSAGLQVQAEVCVLAIYYSKQRWLCSLLVFVKTFTGRNLLAFL